MTRHLHPVTSESEPFILPGEPVARWEVYVASPDGTVLFYLTDGTEAEVIAFAQMHTPPGGSFMAGLLG